MKKIFIKLARLLGYEIIDQNNFVSPSLEKELNDQLSVINQKSIILPLGNVKITKKVKSLLIVLRMNTVVEIWDQKKKRLFEQPKIEYSIRSINSLIKAITVCRNKYPVIKIKTIIVDDQSKKDNLDKIRKLIQDQNIEIIPLDHEKYKSIIKKQEKTETFSNLDEMIASYERIASQVKKDIIMCPADYPYLYMNNEKTNILIGSNRHWRTINKTLCTFMLSKNLLSKYWENFYKTCLDRHDPFEKYINEIYENEVCISPIKSLSLHLTNVNSSYGLSPFLDYKKLWEDNK